MMIYMPDFRVKSAAKRLRKVMHELGRRRAASARWCHPRKN